MKLISLDLENVCQLARLHWEFAPGLVGIFGPNGAGKSNAINAGCYATLTNDYSRVLGGKAGTPRQRRPEGAESRATLRAVHRGQEFTLTRVLAPKVRHELILGGGPPITKDTEIEEALGKVLGGSRRFLKDYVFVHQRDLVRPFELTAAGWAQSLMEICGTAAAESRWKLLGQEIEHTRSQMPTTLDDNRALLQEQIAELRSRRQNALDGIKSIKGQLLSPEDKAAHEKTLRDAQARQAAEAAAVTARTEHAKASRALETVEEARDAAKDLLVNRRLAHLEAQAAATGLVQYREQQQKWGARQAALEEIRRLEGRSLQLAHPGPPPHDREAVATARAENYAERLRAQQLVKLEQSGKAECETCLSPLTGPQAKQRFAEARKTLARTLKRRDEIDAQQKALNEYEQEVAEYEQALAAHDKALALAQQQLQQCPEVEEPKAPTKSTLQTAKLAAPRADALAAAEEAHREAANAAARAEGRQQASAKALAKAEMALAKLGDISEADVKLAYSSLGADQNLREKLAALRAQAQEILTALETRKEELRRVETLFRRGAAARRWLSLCEGGRAVLHRDNLPRIVHRETLRRLEAHINKVLKDFDSPFRVTTDDALNLVARKRDGTVTLAAGLSGGEQVVLALAYRWTLNSLFASQVGMLVLDEPTVNLDRRNIACLERALTRLGEMAKARGYQVILITHEEPLMRVFDQVLTLDRVTNHANATDSGDKAPRGPRRAGVVRGARKKRD